MTPAILANIVDCARKRAFIAAAADDGARCWRELAAVGRLFGFSSAVVVFDQLALEASSPGPVSIYTAR
jgi:hypothetical protein